MSPEEKEKRLALATEALWDLSTADLVDMILENIPDQKLIDLTEPLMEE